MRILSLNSSVLAAAALAAALSGCGANTADLPGGGPMAPGELEMVDGPPQNGAELLALGELDDEVGQTSQELGNGTGNSATVAGIDGALEVILDTYGFSGRIQTQLEYRLGRKLNLNLANIGRNAFFDSLLALNDDNSCSGCHSPTAGWGDSQAIAIGVENNQKVGPHRVGPRNQRRTPGIINNAFYPALMWNSRFSANSGEQFSNVGGFTFPAPEGSTLDFMPTLLAAQAFIPPTENPEMAGMDAIGSHEDIRSMVIRRLNKNANYRQLFGVVFPSVAKGGPITYRMLALAIAEFEFSQTYVNAPIDKYARGNKNALTLDEKKGALLFFTKAGCVSCHAVSGKANEMFSDFVPHNIGVPPVFATTTNVTWDGPGKNEDFGLEQITGLATDRYEFRTSPLRNIGLSPRYMHNGAFSSLEDSIKHHLDVDDSLHKFNKSGLPVDCQNQTPANEIVLTNLDSRMAQPLALTQAEISQLVKFVGNALTDQKAKPSELRKLIPTALPSGRPVQTFE